MPFPVGRQCPARLPRPLTGLLAAFLGTRCAPDRDAAPPAATPDEAQICTTYSFDSVPEAWALPTDVPPGTFAQANRSAPRPLGWPSPGRWSPR